MQWDVMGRAVVAAIVFSAAGIVVFGAAWWVINKITPFSIRKEIEEDHNTALAILIGSVIIGIGLIISAAMHG